MSSSIQPLVFTGISQFSSDFQQILNRAVQLASLPLQQLQQEQSNTQQQQVSAASLGGIVGNLATSLGALGSLGANKALVATSTDSDLVAATVTGATSNAAYNISNVTSVARAASESSLQSYADPNNTPVSATGSLQLTVGANQYNITLASGQNNLVGLEQAINGLNAGVTAQILTTGNGDYLSVSANSSGATTLKLVDDPTGAATQLLTNQNQGANTVFQFNGVNISEPTSNINNLVPGMTFKILGTTTPGQTVGISLTSDSSQLSTALQSLVTSYNAVAQQVNSQIGPGAGSLSGNPIIWQLRGAMLNLVNYQGGTGSIHNLSDLGISMDQTGQMSFDSSKVDGLSSSQLSDAFSFLGSATTGLGNLQNAFSQISDPITGAIQSQLRSFTATEQRLSDQITQLTSRITLMQTTLQSKLQMADASVAQLQSQQNLLTSSIQSLNFSTYGQQLLTNQGL